LNDAYNNIPTPKTYTKLETQDLRPTPGVHIEAGFHTQTDNDTKPQRIRNPIMRKLREIEILQKNERRMIADVQGDSGANVSATNDKSLLWEYETFDNPIPVTTYGEDAMNQNEPSSCQAIGKGIIKLISDDDQILRTTALHIPNSTGTIISPDHYMRTTKGIHSFNHRGDRNGKGTIEFDNIDGTRHATISMKARQGLWYTTNFSLINTDNE
jgi:hypothetical protein